MRILGILLAVAWSGLLMSCGGGAEDTWDKLGRDKVDYMKEVVKILKEVESGGSPAKAARKIEKWGKRGDKLVEREEALGDTTSEEAKAMELKYKGELQGVVLEFVGVLQKLKQSGGITPELADALRNVKGT